MHAPRVMINPSLGRLGGMAPLEFESSCRSAGVDGRSSSGWMESGDVSAVGRSWPGRGSAAFQYLLVLYMEGVTTMMSAADSGAVSRRRVGRGRQFGGNSLLCPACLIKINSVAFVSVQVTSVRLTGAVV